MGQKEMLWRKPPKDIAKVGVERSNPFARSRFRSGQRPLKTATFRVFGSSQSERPEWDRKRVVTRGNATA
jgi:hypothetical protein